MFRKELKSTVEWLLAKQDPDGFWGTHGTVDGFRTPLCMVFLNWYYINIDPDPKVAESVRKYCRFLVDPANSRAHYVKRNALITGFVGEAVAEVISPGSAF